MRMTIPMRYESSGQNQNRTRSDQAYNYTRMYVIMYVCEADESVYEGTG